MATPAEDQGRLFAITREFRAKLDAHEAGARAEMADSYRAIYLRLNAEADALAAAFEEDLLSDESLDIWVAEKGRIDALIRQTQAELNQWSPDAAAISGVQVDAGALLGVRGAEASIGELATSFSRLHTPAVLQMVGATSEGSPLADLFKSIAPDQAQLIRQKLVDGIAAGLNPRVIAEELHQANLMPLYRANMITQTEVQRAYRDATQLSYEENADVVAEWIWTATLGSRCCAACVALHGTRHPVTEKQHGHPWCYCGMTPVVPGYDTGAYEPGEDWLKRQDEATQRDVLGTATGYDAWKKGEVGLDQFIGVHKSPDYGPMVVQKPISDILGKDEVKRRSAALSLKRRAEAAAKPRKPLPAPPAKLPLTPRQERNRRLRKKLREGPTPTTG